MLTGRRVVTSRKVTFIEGTLGSQHLSLPECTIASEHVFRDDFFIPYSSPVEAEVSTDAHPFFSSVSGSGKGSVLCLGIRTELGNQSWKK
jgi:hypothetical protein